MKRTLLFLPLVLLIVAVLFLVFQLKNSERLSPSEDWRGKPFPEFQLPNLLDRHQPISKADLPKEPFIINVWASWCSWCIKEFPVLLKMKQEGVQIVGLTYVDKPDDARQALQQWGNPFQLIIDDFEHDLLLQTLNINAAPSSYVVDKNGIVRYQQRGYHPDFEQKLRENLAILQAEK